MFMYFSFDKMCKQVILVSISLLLRSFPSCSLLFVSFCFSICFELACQDL